MIIFIINIMHLLFPCLQSGRAAGKPSGASGGPATPSSSTAVTQTLEHAFKRLMHPHQK